MTRFLIALLVLSTAVAIVGRGDVKLAGFAGSALALSGLLLAAGRWTFRRRARMRVEGLRALHPHEFEEEVAKWLRRDGWHVERVGGTGDGGIDLLANRKTDVLAVQCKRYAEHAAVSAAQVRDLYGAAVALGATGALLVTTGRVSAAARSWAAALPEAPAVAFHDLNDVAELARGRVRVKAN